MLTYTYLSNAYIMALLKYLVPSLLIGFSLYIMADYANKSLGLLEPGVPEKKAEEAADEEEKEPLV